MMLLLIGGLVVGVLLTILYLSLAEFFRVNAKALKTNEKTAEAGGGGVEGTTTVDKTKTARIGK